MDVRGEVLALAKSYLTRVQKSGPDNVQAICPFHVKADGRAEKNPSFRMSLSKGLYFCHSCGARGNVYTFLKNHDVPASEIEARYSFLIEEASKNGPAPRNESNPDRVFNLEPLPEATLGFFDGCPAELLEDGFTMDTLRHFEVGVDYVHGRITYPLRDLNGRLVGVSGRTPKGDTRSPRYKVYTTEYEHWRLPAQQEPSKTGLLWNAHAVYPEVYFLPPNQSYVVVVEGFKAAMWMYQCGYRNVVALLGSYLSWEHKWILERLGTRVYLFLDNNYAGRNGTINAAETLHKSVDVRIMQYPERLIDDESAQPDDVTALEAREAKTKAPSYLSWIMNFA